MKGLAASERKMKEKLTSFGQSDCLVVLFVCLFEMGSYDIVQAALRLFAVYHIGICASATVSILIPEGYYFAEKAAWLKSSEIK